MSEEQPKPIANEGEVDTAINQNKTQEPKKINLGDIGSLARSLDKVINTFKEERKLGGQIKSDLYERLENILEEEQFHQESTEGTRGTGHESDKAILINKIFRFRPRLVGAIGAYSLFADTSFEAIKQQGGMDAFYLFWALGSIQDDFIDELQKTEGKDSSSKERKSAVGKAIFGDERKFYRATFYLLKRGIKDSTNLGQEQKAYLISKIADWYKFIIGQESEVINTPLEKMDFAYSQNSTTTS